MHMHSFVRRLRKLLLILVLLAVVSINLLAWMQARAMTHFVPAGGHPSVIAELSLGERLNLAFFGLPVPRPANHHTPADGGYAYEVHTIPLPANEWLEAWAVQHPQPRGMALLFHGYAASKQQVLRAAEVLYSLGYSVFLVDFRGGGGSSGATTTLGMREADDVAYAVSYVQQMWPGQRVILYSTSMGSSAVLRAVAQEGVQPAAIIAETPFDRLSNAVYVRFHRMGFPPFPAAELLMFWGGVQHGLNAFAHNPVEYAQAITVPTVLMRGAGTRM